MSIYNVMLILGAAVCLFSLIISFYFIRKQGDKELDRDVHPNTVRHQIGANPIVIGYWIFPILVILGAILLAIFLR